MNTRIKIILGALIVILIAGVVIWLFPKENPAQGGVSQNVTVLFGSKTGTSTTGVYYGRTNGTSSKAVFIGSEVDTVVFKIFPVLASSTAKFSWQVFQSDDPDCATTAETGTLTNAIMASQINWYDAFPKTTVTGGNVAITAATTTFTWAPGRSSTTTATSTRGVTQTITDLNTNCLRFDVGVASSSLYAELKAKIR